MTSKTRQATCPRDQTPLVWIDDQIGYRCPRCALFVCIPKQSDDQNTPTTSEETNSMTTTDTAWDRKTSAEADAVEAAMQVADITEDEALAIVRAIRAA